MARHGRRETGSRRSERCGKLRYNSELDAKMALAFTRAKDRGEQRYYHHTFCGGYHLTSEKTREEQKVV
jgi:hypothetical protein